jgi:hypothetical protein
VQSDLPAVAVLMFVWIARERIFGSMNGMRAVRGGVFTMTKAIEHIVTGYSTLKNRKALEEIRDHRRRLLNENRMRSNSVLNFESIMGF